MSTLSTRLKRRAKVLATGVALSAATLAILPGVAEAKKGEHNANGTRGSIGAATAQDGADVKDNNIKANPQLAVGHASNEAKHDQRAGGGASPDGGPADRARNDNETRGSIGVLTAQDGGDVEGNNVTVNPQVSVLGGSNRSHSDQETGGSGGPANDDERNSNGTGGSIGAAAVQDGVDLNRNNVEVGPQVSVLGSSNDARTDQQAGGGGDSANDERNANETSGSVGAVTPQNGVNFGDNSVDVSPQISALGSSNESYTDQRTDSGGSNSPANGDERNDNRTSGSTDVVSGQDVADTSGNNVGANPQVALLGGSNRAGTDQQTGGSGVPAADERNDNEASGSLGAVAAQDGVDLNRNNVEVGPQVSALGSSNDARTGQQAGGGGSANGERNDNETSGSVGAVTLQDGVNFGGNNAYAGPQGSALDGSNRTDTHQQTGNDPSGGSADNRRNSNDTSGSILTGTVQDGVNLHRDNVGLGPQVAALDSSNRTNADQRTGGGSGSGPTATEERNGNQTSGSIGTITAQDVADAEANNLDAAPQAALVDGSNRTNTEQGGGGSDGRHPANGERNSNRTEGSLSMVAAQDALDVEGNNVNATPQAAALDSSNSADTDQQSGSNGSGGSAAEERNANETPGSILTGAVQDGVDVEGDNLNAAPQVAPLDGSNEADANQQSGVGPSNAGEQNTNETSGSVGTLTGQDVLDVQENNLNAVPQVAALDGSSEADTAQQTGGSGGSTNEEQNTNDTSGSVGTVTLQDLLDASGNNANASPQISVLDGSNGSDTQQNGGDPGDGGGGGPGDGGSGGDGGPGGDDSGDGGGDGPGGGGPGGGGPGGGGGSPGGEPTDAGAFARGFPLLGRVVEDLLGTAGSHAPAFAELGPGSGVDGDPAAVPVGGIIPLSDVVPPSSALGGADPRLTAGGSAAQYRPILASLGRGDSILASLRRGDSEGSTVRVSALVAGPNASTSASTRGARSLPDTGGLGLWPLALGLSLLLSGFALTVGARRGLLALKR